MSAAEEEMENGAEAMSMDFGQTLAGMAAEAGLVGGAKVNTFTPDLQTESNEPTAGAGGQADNSAMIMGLPVMMKVVLGSAKMPVATLAKLAKGSVVKLDKMVGDPVDILVNGRLIARGEVVVLNEGSSRFGVVLTQIGGLTPSAK